MSRGHVLADHPSASFGELAGFVFPGGRGPRPGQQDRHGRRLIAAGGSCDQPAGHREKRGTTNRKNDNPRGNKRRLVHAGSHFDQALATCSPQDE